MGNICGSKLPKPNNENESDNAQVVPSTMSEGNLQQHNKSNNIAPILIKRQPTDDSVDSDVYASVKGPKGERLSMLQKKDTITDSLKGASHATQKLVHDSDANDKRTLSEANLKKNGFSLYQKDQADGSYHKKTGNGPESLHP